MIGKFLKTRMRRVMLAASLFIIASACTDDLSGPTPAEPSLNRNGRGESVRFWLTLIHNNDGESALINAGQGLEDFGGVARFATLLDDLRDVGRYPTVTGKRGRDWDREEWPDSWDDGSGRAVRGSIVVSSGDNYLAGPQFNASLKAGIFYDALALGAIGYDAFAIGNHEFDFGPELLADFISSARPECRPRLARHKHLCERFRNSAPWLSANLDFRNEPSLQSLVRRDRVAGSTIISERGQRIGIIGATTPMLPFISSPRNVIVEEVVPAILEEVWKLERRGVNKIVLVSHLQSVQEDLALIPNLRGVDIVVAGGGDELLANSHNILIPGDVSSGSYPLEAIDADGNVVPVVTTSGSYKYVGRLVVGFDKRGRIVAVDNKESGPVRVAGGAQPDAVVPDPYIQSRVVEPVVAAIAAQASNVIATSQVALDGRRSQVRSVETNQGNLIADAFLWQATQLAAAFGQPVPQVALQNGGGIRNDVIVPAGGLTELFTFQALPFLNFLSIIPSVPRSQFKEILENAVSRVEFGDGRFAQIAGFSFVWDPAGTPQVVDAAGNVTTPGTRVHAVTLDGGEAIVTDGAVVAGGNLVVASIDFLAKGGDLYPFRGLPFTTLGVTYQQALFNYLVSGVGGVVTSAAYPEGGSGRITRVITP